jgi:hypothetical protein
VRDRCQHEEVQVPLLDEQDIFSFRQCTEGCKRRCLHKLWVRDPRMLMRVAETGKKMRDTLERLKYNNSVRFTRQRYKRKHVSHSRGECGVAQESISGRGSMTY